MMEEILRNPLFRSKFLHYFLIIVSLFFLFTLGPRILVDQLSSSNPNTAIAQDCGQQPCPEVPVPPQPPQECTTSCPAGKTGTCGGHKYWDQAAGAYGECQCETEAQTCQEPQPAPTQPPQQCTSDEVVGTTQHCVGNQMCTFNTHRRADCSTYEGGAYGCQNSTACGFTTPPPPAPVPPPPTQTCQDQLFDCSCNGTDYKCMHRQTDCTTSVEIHNELGAASACRVTAAPAATSAPAQGGTSTSTSNSTANSNSAANANASANQSQNQSQTQAQSQVTNVTNSNTNNNTNNNNQNQTVSVAGVTTIVWVTPSPTSTATPAPTPTPVTTTRRVTTVVVGQGGGGPQVIGKTQVQGSVQELPKTGLPVVGLALLGLVPIGWKLRKYAFKTWDPSSIWNDRELKK